MALTSGQPSIFRRDPRCRTGIEPVVHASVPRDRRRIVRWTYEHAHRHHRDGVIRKKRPGIGMTECQVHGVEHGDKIEVRQHPYEWAVTMSGVRDDLLTVASEARIGVNTREDLIRGFVVVECEADLL